MNLIPWRTKSKDGNTAPLTELRNEMDRLFDSLIRDPWSSLGETFGGPKLWPALDVTEDDRQVTVRAEIPGVDPKELEITVSGNRLTIAGEKKESTQQEGKDYHISETRYGSFHRSVDLPSPVNSENVGATYEHGVLVIKLDKTQAAAARKIEVRTS